MRLQGIVSTTVNDSAADVVLAEALLSEGQVTRQRLDEILAEQAASVLRLMLLWTDGTWAFDGRARLGESIQVKVATRQILLEATRRLDVQFASSRFPNGHESVFPVSDPVDALNLLPTEAFLLSRVEGQISVDDLIALSGLQESEAKRGIYGLLLVGLLKREFWPLAFKALTPQAAKSQADKAKANAAVKTAVPPPKKPAPVVPKRDPRRELDAFLERLEEASNHYEVLDLPLTADVVEIKRMYHSIARNFHPDRFHGLAGTDTHTSLQSAFARITQAYETLTNPQQRTSYDAKVHALRKVRESQATSASRGKSVKHKSAETNENGDNLAELAEKRFQEGAAALQQGQTNAATSSFSAAARLAPNEAKYRAYYGRALAVNPKTRRLAEAELQAALKLEPSNAAYHVMLAILYRDLGFALRAVGELDRALALDPQNAEARQILNALEQKK
jgi:curved DNA-binding protein CbpA